VPNIALRHSSLSIETFDDDLRSLITEMTMTMLAENGIGLAAPQVEILRRVIVVKFPVRHLINPRVIESTQELCSLKEGCLSIPNQQVVVQRPSRVNVEYQDLDGEKHVRWFAGLESRVIQHEIDHLDGILMIDRKMI
jgi:peptide deformylase